MIPPSFYLHHVDKYTLHDVDDIVNRLHGIVIKKRPQDFSRGRQYSQFSKDLYADPSLV